MGCNDSCDSISWVHKHSVKKSEDPNSKTNARPHNVAPVRVIQLLCQALEQFNADEMALYRAEIWCR